MATQNREVVLALIESIASNIERSYRSYTLQLSGLFARVLNSRDAVSPMAKHELEESIHASQLESLQVFKNVIDEQIKKLEAMAVENANRFLSDQERETLDTLVKDMVDDAWSRMVTVMINDGQKILRSWRDFAFAVSRMVNEGQTQYFSIAMSRPKALTNIKFEYPDRTGRMWSSITFMRTTIRSVALMAYVESYLYALSARPNDVAVVEHNPEHENNGIRFSITGMNPELPSYESIREEVFHPNSRALVAMA